MNRDPRPECENLRPFVDVWLDNELNPTDAGILEGHLRNCANCALLISQRRALRARLKTAAHSVEVPVGLGLKIRQNRAPANRAARYGWLLLPVAAAILMTAGLTNRWQNGGLRFTRASQEAYIAEVSPRVSPVMRVGLQQHVHCAVFRKSSAGPTAAQMTEWLGRQYQELLPALRRHLPPGFQVVDAHRCTYRGRAYAHLAASDGKRLISLLITSRAQGEAFENDLRAVASQAGVPVYTSAVQRFSLAGLETPEYLVYLISDLDNIENLTALRTLAPDLVASLRRPATS